jgi:hypothetical protein
MNLENNDDTKNVVYKKGRNNFRSTDFDKRIPWIITALYETALSSLSPKPYSKPIDTFSSINQ